MPSPNSAWSSGGASRGSPTTRSTSSSSSPPSGTDASAGFGTCNSSSRRRASASANRGSFAASSSLSAPAAAILAVALVGRRLADLLRRRVLARPELFDLGEQRPSGVVGHEHVVDQPGGDPLALDPGAVSGSSRSRLRSITWCRRAAHPAAQLVDPLRRPAPRLVGRGRRSALLLTGDRVRAEELHLGLLGRQVPQAVGDELVGDVAFEVDEEAVVAEAPLRRPRLELREVDGTRRELLEDREQRTRPVLALEADDAGLVVAGRRRDAVADEHEARLVSGGPRSRWRGRRARRAGRRTRCRSTPCPVLDSRHLLGGLRGRVRARAVGLGQLARPARPGTARAGGMRDHGPDVVELRARAARRGSARPGGRSRAG